MKKIILLLILSTIISLSNELPIEPSLSQGKLKNGFKYTIMHNQKPKNRAELRLLVKVGSLEEEDDQQGVAHFIEHLAFNGSKNFKKNELISYLESIGVKFGNDLNANTNFEKTLYMLTIPLEKDNLKKSFLVFSDWANGLSFNPKEFDKERGVILEEARLRDNVHLRIFHQYKALLYGNSPYLNREPIGKTEIIKTIPIQRAKAFYQRWYRPELMHFVAVGDFNTTEIKRLIKETFSDLKNSNHQKTLPRVIPENNTTRIKTVWDEELTANYLSVYYMDRLYPLRTKENLKESIIETILLKLFNAKADEQIEKNHPKATVIKFSSSQLNHDRGYYAFFAQYKGEDELLALKELYSIIWGFQKYGFSKNALNRAKNALLAENKKRYQQVHDQKSSRLSHKIVKSIVSDSIFIAYDVEHRLIKSLINEIKIEDIDRLFRKIINFKDRVILFQNNHGKQYTREEVLSTINQAKRNLKAEDKEKKLPKNLLIKELVKRKIISREYHKKSDMHQFILENGVKVAFKKSSFSKNNVILKGFSFGGKSIYKPKDLLTVARSTLFVSSSGAGEFSRLELQKILLGTTLSLYTTIQARSEEINGKSNIHDIENMFALLYLKITQPKIDKNIARNIKNILKVKAQEALNNPQEKFYREMKKYYYQNSPRIQFETPKEIEAFDDSRLLSIYKERYSDLNNFVFVIIGDISLKKVEELSQKYLANLPTLNREESFVKRDLPYRKGHLTFVKNYNHENISHIRLEYKSKIPYNEKDELLAQAVNQILTVRLRKLIREEKSAVYNINTLISLDMLEDRSIAVISFACDPERKEELLKMINGSIEKIKKNLVSPKELAVYKKGFATKQETDLKENRYWLRAIEKFYKKEIPLHNIYKYTTLNNQITSQDILEFANRVFGEDIIQMELNPKE